MMRLLLVLICLVAAGLIGNAAQAVTIETFTVHSGGSAVPTDHPYFSSDGSTSITIISAGETGTPVYYISTDPELPAEPDWKTHLELDLWPTVSAGMTTFYAWVTDDTEAIEGPSQDWIVHNDEDTNPTTITVDEDFTFAAPYSITIQWDTDINAIGWLAYRIDGSGEPYQITQPSPTGFAGIHTISIPGLIDETVYDIIIHANGATVSRQMTTPTAPGVDVDVTWTGAAENDDRWARGSNWVEGNPPNNPTPGTLTFPVAGTSIVSPSTDTWSISKINATNTVSGTTKNIIFELDSKTLEVRNELLASTGGAWNTYLNATFQNGTLRIGTPEVAGNLVLNIYNTPYNNPGRQTLKIDPSVILEPYINMIKLGDDGSPMNGQSILDIRSTN